MIRWRLIKSLVTFNQRPLVIGLHEKSRISSFIKLENKLRALTGRSRECHVVLYAKEFSRHVYMKQPQFHIDISRKDFQKESYLSPATYLPSHTGCELKRYFWRYIKIYVLRFDFMTLDLFIVADTNVTETKVGFSLSQNISIHSISNIYRL